MPTATDLVTDLPADFEVFGQAVATSMADLLGGTSGQILAKNSNTDMDFVWITNDVGDITAVTAGTGISGGGTSGAVTITNSMATEIAAKGDLIVGTGSATFDNLGVGTNGQVLTADSTVSPTGLKWATPASGSTFVGCSLSKNASQSITNGATTALTFQVELFDTDGFHSTSSNTERITIPAGKGGYYLIVGQVSMTGTATLTNVRRVPDIRKNGSSTLKNVDAPIGQDYPNATVMAFANLAVADYIELRVYNGQGSSLPINDGPEATQFAAYYLGA